MIRLDPLRPGPGEAHDWLRRELLHRAYQPSLLERVQTWFDDLVDKAQDAGGSLGGLGWPVLLLLVVALVALAAFALSRLQRNPVAEARTESVFDDVRRTAAEHRLLARAGFTGEDWDTAVVESMRALAAGLVERGVVADVPAATAHEVTAQAAPRYPAITDRLAEGAAIFDETRYGDRHATRERARTMLDLDDSLHATRPGSPAGRGGPVEAVPR